MPEHLKAVENSLQAMRPTHRASIHHLQCSTLHCLTSPGCTSLRRHQRSYCTPCAALSIITTHLPHTLCTPLSLHTSSADGPTLSRCPHNPCPRHSVSCLSSSFLHLLRLTPLCRPVTCPLPPSSPTPPFPPSSRRSGCPGCPCQPLSSRSPPSASTSSTPPFTPSSCTSSTDLTGQWPTSTPSQPPPPTTHSPHLFL